MQVSSVSSVSSNKDQRPLPPRDQQACSPSQVKTVDRSRPCRDVYPTPLTVIAERLGPLGSFAYERNWPLTIGESCLLLQGGIYSFVLMAYFIYYMSFDL